MLVAAVKRELRRKASSWCVPIQLFQEPPLELPAKHARNDDRALLTLQPVDLASIIKAPRSVPVARSPLTLVLVPPTLFTPTHVLFFPLTLYSFQLTSWVFILPA